MTWKPRSDRRAQLPPHWHLIRKAALRRDGHRCTHIEHGRRCDAKATDVDHIGDNNDDRLDNLRSLCTTHHGRRTSAQGNTTRGVVITSRRPPESHPGLDRPGTWG